MERIKFDDDKPAPNIHRMVAEQSKLARKRQKLAYKPRPKLKPKPKPDDIMTDLELLAYRYRLRDIMKARFGHSAWMSTLPPLERSGLYKTEEGFYRTVVNKRIK